MQEIKKYQLDILEFAAVHSSSSGTGSEWSLSYSGVSLGERHQKFVEIQAPGLQSQHWSWQRVDNLEGSD